MYTPDVRGPDIKIVGNQKIPWTTARAPVTHSAIPFLSFAFTGFCEATYATDFIYCILITRCRKKDPSYARVYSRRLKVIYQLAHPTHYRPAVCPRVFRSYPEFTPLEEDEGPSLRSPRVNSTNCALAGLLK